MAPHKHFYKQEEFKRVRERGQIKTKISSKRCKDTHVALPSMQSIQELLQNLLIVEEFL